MRKIKNVMSEKSVKFIDNIYSPEEATEILISLINDKIKFLNLQIFSKSERFGTDTSHLENRIKYLELEKENLMKQIEKAEMDGKNLSIQCEIQIEFIGTADIL